MDKLDPNNRIGFSSVVAKVNEIVAFLNRRNGCFKPPTPQEVEAYAKEYAGKHSGIDGDISGADFCDFYESKGWMIGKSKMKCWQAAVRKCCRDGWCGPQAAQKKTPLFPISGRKCSQCPLPAVYKDSGGAYDFYYCSDHMPEEVKAKYE